MEIYSGALDTKAILNNWYEKERMLNNGAFITFVGIVRQGEDADGLSFDVHEPLLLKWFDSWQERAKKDGAKVLMAHSKGDVMAHETSFIAGVCSRHRKAALALINDFVEDFKANAPIWKYDIKGNERVYAKERSKAITGAGLLG